MVLGLVVAGIGAAFFTGVLGTPSAGLEDRGDWGNVSEQRTEVITTVWVNNPNPVGVSVSDSLEVSYQLYLNDINLANGEKSGISIPAGNNTVQISTYIQNQDIPPWWVAFIQNNETIPIRADATADVGGTVSASVDFPTQEETVLAEETPIITSLSEVAGGTEGTYTKNISQDRVRDRLGIDRSTLLSEGYVIDWNSEVTVGYEVQDGWAEWGEVTEETTTVYFHFRIHNPGDIPVPTAPSNMGVDVAMNDVEMFSAQANDTSLQNPEDFSDGDLVGERVLESGETEEAVYAVEMNNENIDDWFRSHVQQEERTNIRTEAKLVFSIQDVEFAVPSESPIAYTCDFQTDILVDDQNTSTDCGEIADETNDSQDETDNSEDETETNVELPSAVADVIQTSGEASLNVTFDASDSTAPDTEIVEYAWMIGDASEPATGKQVTYRFHSGGEYTVKLVITDNRGNTDTDTVTIDVDPETSEPPTAVAEATPTSGEAPLEVTFDASDSSDPDGDIQRYGWRFKDGSTPAEGETVTHTFQTAGEYDVELVVFDSQGNQDSTTITVTVESRVG